MIVARVHRVVIVIGDDPFERPFGGSAKFTTPGVAVTVNEDGKFALKLIGPAGELTCAERRGTQARPEQDQGQGPPHRGPSQVLANSNSPMLIQISTSWSWSSTLDCLSLDIQRARVGARWQIQAGRVDLEAQGIRVGGVEGSRPADGARVDNLAVHAIRTGAAGER